MLITGARRLSREAFARPGFASAIIHAGGLAVRLAFMFALLTWFGAALLGRYGLLVSIEMVAIYAAGFEFHSFTTRRYARHPGARSLKLALACHRRLLMVSIPLAAVGSASAAYVFGVGLSIFEMALFCIIVSAGVVTQETVRFIVMAANPLYSVLVGALRIAFWQPIALLFLFSMPSLTPVLLAWTVAAVASTAWGLWLLRRGISFKIRPKWRYIWHGARLARPFYATATATVIQGNLERFVLQSFLGPEAVGIFGFFQNLANALPALVQAAVFNLWLPQILNHFGRSGADRFELLRRVVRRTLLVSGVLGGGIGVGVLALALLVGREGFFVHGWILFVLLLGQVLQLRTQPYYLALYGAHRDGAIMRLSLGVFAASLLTSITMVACFGMTGAAISQMAGALMTVVSRITVFRLFRRRGLV